MKWVALGLVILACLCYMVATWAHLIASVAGYLISGKAWNPLNLDGQGVFIVVVVYFVAHIVAAIAATIAKDLD